MSYSSVAVKPTVQAAVVTRPRGTPSRATELSKRQLIAHGSLKAPCATGTSIVQGGLRSRARVPRDAKQRIQWGPRKGGSDGREEDSKQEPQLRRVEGLRRLEGRRPLEGLRRSGPQAWEPCSFDRCGTEPVWRVEAEGRGTTVAK